MKARTSSFSIVDFLVIIAILMIFSAMVIPHFAKCSQKGKSAQPKPPAARVLPRR